MAEHDLQDQEAMKAAKVPDCTTVAFSSCQPTKAGHDCVGIARTPDGRAFPFYGLIGVLFKFAQDGLHREARATLPDTSGHRDLSDVMSRR